MDEGGAMMIQDIFSKRTTVASGNVFSYPTQWGCRWTVPTGSAFAPDRCNTLCSETFACNSSLRVEAAGAVGILPGNMVAQLDGSSSYGPHNTRNAAGSLERGFAIEMSHRC